MLLSAATGRLNTKKVLPFQFRATLAGVTSCVERDSGIPSTSVSLAAVQVAFPIAWSVFCSDAITNVLRDRAGSVAEYRASQVCTYCWRRLGFPMVSTSGFELLTTSWSWVTLGARVAPLHESRRLRWFGRLSLIS